MLQKLNERIQGVVAWIIIILVTVTFMLFGLDYYIQSRHESTAQAEVNGEPITKQAFDLSYRRIRQLREPAQLDALRENQLKQQILNDMIMNSLSIQSARLNGFEVNAAQANATILNIPQFQQDGRFSTNRYAQALNGAFFTPESFQKEVRQGMLLNQQRFAMIGTAFALPNELKQYVRLYLQTRDYNYLQIPAIRFLKETSVSDKEISNYYENNKKVFLTPEKVSIDYIRLSMRDIRNNLSISPVEIKRYYDDNSNSYQMPAEWQVAQISFHMTPNASEEEQKNFKKYMEKIDVTLKNEPGKFETISQQKPVKLHLIAGQPGFDNSLVNLTTPGQFSAPIKVNDNYVIYKLIAYKPAEIKSYQQVEADIKEQLLNERAQTKYTQTLEQLSDLSYQTPDSLTPVADTLKLPVEHSELFSRHGGDTAITKNAQVIRTAFSHEVLKFGNNSEPVQLDNDSVLVLRINKHIPTAEKALVDVKLLIAEKLAKKKAAAEAKQFGQSLLNEKQNFMKQEKLIAANSLEWHDIKDAHRDSDVVPSIINELAFNIPNVGAQDGNELSNGDFAIVSLKKITDGRIESLDKEQLSNITQQIEANYGLMDYDLYLNNLMRNAKIVRH